MMQEVNTLSNETLSILTTKYKMMYVQPTKPYFLKLQRIKDKMAYALKN